MNRGCLSMGTSKCLSSVSDPDPSSLASMPIFQKPTTNSMVEWRRLCLMITQEEVA